MSVQVIAYEIFKNSNIEIDTEWQDHQNNSEELTMLIDRFVDTSYKLNLFDEENAKKFLSELKECLRLKPDKMEGNFLRGFLLELIKLSNQYLKEAFK